MAPPCGLPTHQGARRLAPTAPNMGARNRAPPCSSRSSQRLPPKTKCFRLTASSCIVVVQQSGGASLRPAGCGQTARGRPIWARGRARHRQARAGRSFRRPNGPLAANDDAASRRRWAARIKKLAGRRRSGAHESIWCEPSAWRRHSNNWARAGVRTYEISRLGPWPPDATGAETSSPSRVAQPPGRQRHRVTRSSRASTRRAGLAAPPSGLARPASLAGRPIMKAPDLFLPMSRPRQSGRHLAPCAHTATTATKLPESFSANLGPRPQMCPPEVAGTRIDGGARIRAPAPAQLFPARAQTRPPKQGGSEISSSGPGAFK